MRRLVAAITRRSSKSDAGNTTDSTQDLQHPKSSFFRSLSRKVSSRPVNQDADSAADPRSKRHPIPPVNTLTTQPNQAPSSSSSSSGGPHTPDDDASSFLRTVLHKGRNEPWFPPSPQAVDNPSVPPHSASQASHPPPSFLALPVLPPLRLSQDDTEDDDSDLESSESEPSQLQPPPIPRPSLLHSHPLQLLSPVAYFHALTTSALQPPFSPPPLLDLPNLPLFPRSSNPTRSLVHNESLLSSMFKQRLSRRTLPPVSPDAQIALSPLGPHKPAPHPRPSLFLDDTALKDYSTVNVPSQGLKLWLNRPCFEDRLDVFLPDDPTGFVIQMPVSASTLGVAALEFTEPLELLAGLYDPQEDVPQIPVASPTLISPLSLSPSVSQPSPSLSPPSPQPQCKFPASISSRLTQLTSLLATLPFSYIPSHQPATVLQDCGALATAYGNVL